MLHRRAPSANAKIVSNGLPVFPLFYSNDDDGERKLGADSKLLFTAPADGEYLVRVADTRGFSGDRLAYRLNVRAPEPDFVVRLKASDLSINAGSGQAFTIEAERSDGFEDTIDVEFSHLPPGFAVSTPLPIEAGHTEADGAVRAAPDASQPSSEEWAKVQVTASAKASGHVFVKAVNNFGVVKLAKASELLVALEPETSSSAVSVPVNGPQISDGTERTLELTIAPGQTIPAVLRVRRHRLRRPDHFHRRTCLTASSWTTSA